MSCDKYHWKIGESRWNIIILKLPFCSQFSSFVKSYFKKLAYIYTKYYNKYFLWRYLFLCWVWKKKQDNIWFYFFQIAFKYLKYFMINVLNII